jgi:CheY-like chemotaxis protein
MNAPVLANRLMNLSPLFDNRLLILEDDKAIGELLLTQAEGKGLMGLIVPNNQRFIETYRRINPSLLILDIVLGDEDVMPTIDFLRKVGCRCPIFFLTGYNQLLLKRVSEKARASGLMIVGAFEKKAEGIPQLMDKIEKYILC